MGNRMVSEEFLYDVTRLLDAIGYFDDVDLSPEIEEICDDINQHIGEKVQAIKARQAFQEKRRAIRGAHD